MTRLTLTLLLLLCASPAWATTRYVATTGSDANPGTSGSPYLTIQKCIDSTTTPGDVCTVADGTYTSATSRIAVLIYTTTVSGTAGAPIVLRSTNYGGATITVPAHIDGGVGVYLLKNYWTVEGFNISGGGINNGAGSHGIKVESGIIGSYIHHNIIHGMGTGTCTMTTDGIDGISLISGHRATVIEANIIHTIGRLYTGESGCAAGRTANDHGIYVEGTSTNVTIRRNVFYNVVRGWPIHVYKSGTHTSTGLTITNNTFSGKSTLGASGPYGHIILQVSTITNATIKNNISNDAYLGFMNCNEASVTSAIVTISYNLSSGPEKTAACVAGMTFSNNVVNTSPGLVNAGANDYTLASGSAAIDAGTSLGTPYNGSAPDIGAFETFTRTSSTVNGNLLDTTWGMNLNTPILLATGNTGVTALLSAVARTTTSTVRLTGTDSVMRTTFNGAACVGGGTWTETYVPGTITDSALIGGTVNQKGFAYTAASVTNSCGVAPPAEPGTPLIIYLLDDNTGSTADNTGSSAATDDGTLSGTFAWSAGKNTYGVTLTDLTAGSLAVPHGNALDPSATSLTVAFWVNVPAALTGATRTYFGHAGVASNRFYISTLDSTWRIGIQGSNDGTSSNLAVTAGWNRVCLSSGNPTATLSVNGTVGTGGASKSFTSYTFPSDLTLGSPFGASSNPGVIFDDFKLWATAEDCADDFANADPPSPPASGTMAQVAHQFHHLRQTVGGTVEAYGAQSATMRMRAGGAFMLTTQTDCTVAACGSVAERLRYNVNSGAFVEVPDTFGSDGVAFYGSPAASDVDILKGAVTCCLSGALTAIDGATQYTAAAVPVVTFTLGSSTTQRSVLRLDAAITATTVCFKRYTQQGEAYDAYTPAAGACVTVVPVSTGSGF